MPNLKYLENAYPVAPLKLIALESCQNLGQQVNHHLVEFRKHIQQVHSSERYFQGYVEDNYLLKCTCPRFGSGEGKSVLHESVRGKDIYIMVDICNRSISYKMNGYVNYMSPDNHFQDLKRVISVVSGRAHRITVIMPFLYEGRQHKRTGRESLDSALALQELANMGIANLITFDAHDPSIQNSSPLCGFDNFIPPYQFIRALLRYEPDLIIDKDHLIVISPDEGAMSRAIYFANVLSVNTGMFYKRRNFSTIVDGKNPIVAHEFLGENIQGKDVIIMDDMISSGESMLDTARQLKQMRAKRVFIFSTFGLFTKGLEDFDRAFENHYFDRVITTNLSYRMPELFSKPYYIEADMSKFLASIIDFLNHDVSMNGVHTPTEKIQAILARHQERDDFPVYS